MKSLYLFLLNLIKTASNLEDFNKKLNQWKSALNSAELANLVLEVTVDQSQNLLYNVAKRFSQDRKTAAECFAAIKTLGISFEIPPYITKIVKAQRGNQTYFDFDKGENNQRIVFKDKTAFHIAIDLEEPEAAEIKNILEIIYSENKDIDRMYFDPRMDDLIMGTPLDFAIRRRNRTAFTTLIALGACPDQVGPRPDRAKLEQTFAWENDMTQALIVAGANVNYQYSLPNIPLFAFPVVYMKLELAKIVFQSPSLDLTTGMLIPFRTPGSTDYAWGLRCKYGTLIDFLVGKKESKECEAGDEKSKKISDDLEQLAFGYLEKSLIEQVYPIQNALTPFIEVPGVVSLITEYSMKNNAEDFARSEKGLLFMQNTFNAVLGKTKKVMPTATVELKPETAAVSHPKSDTKPTTTLKK